MPPDLYPETAPAARPTTSSACIVCGAPKPQTTELESARVRSNVRKFREETFEVWRCPACRSIHASEEVDLDHYYRSYPIFPALEPRMHATFEGQVRRLTAAGVTKESRIVDYGAGSGLLLDYLALRGFSRAVGYDAHVDRFRDASVLEAKYDCVVSQDVLEHVDDPVELLRVFRGLTVPNGVVVIGTPDADAIDLAHADRYLHTLHAPYHRHILSSRAVRDAAQSAGLRLERFYPTMYGNTLLPMQNPRFGLEYLRSVDDCLDSLTEPPRVTPRLFSPKTAFFAFFGYFFDRHTDVSYVFRLA